MSGRKNLVFLAVLLLTLPFVAAQMSMDLGDALDNGFRAFFDMMQGTYVKVGLTVIFMIILLGNIFNAGLSKVPVFGGRGGANKYGRMVSVSLAILATMGIIFLGPGGPLEMVERVLGAAGMFGGFALAVLTFGIVYMNLKDKEKSWPLTLISVGIGMIVYGMLMDGRSWFSWGWLFLIVGIILFILFGNKPSDGKQGVFSRMFNRGGNTGGTSGGGNTGGGNPGGAGSDPAPEKISGVSAQKRFYGSEMRLYVTWNKAQATNVERYEIMYWNHNRLSSKKIFSVFPAQLSGGMKLNVEFPIKNMSNPMLKMRAIGKNGRKGPWSDKVLATEGGDPEGPAVNEVVVTDKDGHVNYLNAIILPDMDTLHIYGMKFSAGTRIMLKDGSTEIMGPVFEDPTFIDASSITVKVKQPIPNGTYEVVPLSGSFKGKTKAYIEVSTPLDDFSSEPDPSRIPLGASTSVMFKGAKMHEVISWRTGISEIELGKLAEGILFFWKNTPKLREIRSIWNTITSSGNKVIPVPRNLAGNDRRYLGMTTFRERFLSVNDPLLQQAIKKVDFLLNPGLFYITNGTEYLEEGITIKFAGYAVSNIKDPEHSFMDNNLILVFDVKPDFPMEKKDLHIWVQPVRSGRPVRKLGKLTISESVGIIRGRVTVITPPEYSGTTGGSRGGARNVPVKVI